MLLLSVTDETGSGALVFNNTPTLTSPSIISNITTPSTTFALINTTATTLDIGGAATTLRLGASSGTTTIRNNAVINNNLTVGSNVLFVNSNTGNVGIGTTTPANKLNVIGDINATGTIYGTFSGNGSGLTNVNADKLDGYDSSFFMPLNTSVYGNFDFNGGWQNGGLSIIGGDIYAQNRLFC
ncbi:MAG: hypothetical protein KatS3mg001_104 [Candidatus Pacearchaeota archaeon]|nr:MAG: hypothetical protein KatS3mg001_104 [Candidatus Pacearchaeota archaeon]